MMGSIVRGLVRMLAAATDAFADAPGVLRLPDGRAYVLLSRKDGIFVDLRGPNQHWESEGGREYRSHVALELLDPDVYGFMLLALRRDDDGGAQIAFRAQSEPEWTEAFAAGMAQVMLALPS